MADECSEPTQPTQPAKGEPVDVPVPTRRDVFGAFCKVAKPPQRDEDDGLDASDPPRQSNP